MTDLHNITMEVEPLRVQSHEHRKIRTWMKAGISGKGEDPEEKDRAWSRWEREGESVTLAHKKKVRGQKRPKKGGEGGLHVFAWIKRQ